MPAKVIHLNLDIFMSQNIPLAERLRPKNFVDYIGQNHIVGDAAVLRESVKNNTIPSIILWGPPGTGKTTLAHILANETKLPFYAISAIHAGVKDIREVIEKTLNDTQAILFIDEIHRFNKSQQDSLLASVERGNIILIGATTENPSFEVNKALLSRCQVYILKEFTKDELIVLLNNAIKKDVFLNKKNIHIQEYESLLQLSGGDARRLLNTLELVVNFIHSNEIIITNELVQKTVQQRMLSYDKSGEMHYDIISAFIKSMRGSDPNAAVYWLARMIHGGEDPKFIARRMLILASEDIGNANPNALLMANQCFDAVEKIGYPECRIILSQTAIYLAVSPKSNASYMAIEAALEEVKKSTDLSVPLHLRNAPTALMKEIGYGDKYKYAHQFENNFIVQDYLPKEIKGRIFYEPNNNIKENEIRKWLKERWNTFYKY
jgi:putative ATPase